jgi:branched-chain amino acid transport system ATP-binding protein
MNGNALLSCCNLQAGYDASKVLFDVSFAIRPGEVIGLLGRNGMGKSTTIKCITGALSPSQGEIRFRATRWPGCVWIPSPEWVSQPFRKDVNVSPTCR